MDMQTRMHEEMVKYVTMAEEGTERFIPLYFYKGFLDGSMFERCKTISDSSAPSLDKLILEDDFLAELFFKYPTPYTNKELAIALSKKFPRKLDSSWHREKTQ